MQENDVPWSSPRAVGIAAGLMSIAMAGAAACLALAWSARRSGNDSSIPVRAAIQLANGAFLPALYLFYCGRASRRAWFLALLLVAAVVAADIAMLKRMS